MRDSLVIVAIPAEDDYVMQVSTEKIPHLTLLYLGEADADVDLEQIMGFVEHASTLIQPFYMDIEYRGKLGDDEADVLFFEKGWDYKLVQTYRDQLKQNAAIKAAYASVEQFPEWRPHLTLGYPETPANEMEDGRKLYSVRFDRIAVWNGDFKGMEFRLKTRISDRELAMAEVPEGESALQHYGIKGMRWGVRTDRGRGSSSSSPVGGHGKAMVSTPGRGGGVAAKADKAMGVAASAKSIPAARYDRQQSKREQKYPGRDPEYRVQVTKGGGRKIETRGGKGLEPTPEAVNARVLNQQRKASGVQSLSNKQLQDLSTRLNLEQQVTRLTAEPAGGKVRKFVMSQLVNQKDREKNIKNVEALQGMLKSTRKKP